VSTEKKKEHWKIRKLQKDPTTTEQPPLFQAELEDLENTSEGVLPRIINGPEADLRTKLKNHQIPDVEIDQAFGATKPPDPEVNEAAPTKQ